MRDVLHHPGRTYKEFSGGPLIRSLHFHCHGLGLIPGQGSKIPQPKRKKRKEFIKEVAPIYFFFQPWLSTHSRTYKRMEVWERKFLWKNN